MNRHELTQQIKQAALDSGFTKAGVTSAAPFHEAADRLDAWIGAGAQGVMSYMERNREKRRDVREIFPTAKSILSLALNYYREGVTGPLKISRYAWGDDYHDLIGTMLEQLMAKIKIIAPEAEGRYYVDTGPLLEKSIAERAGIGWIGKHTNLITQELGSWVFLSEIILNLDLEADTPGVDMCGTCTKCIEACPTDAITAPYQLDATKCISYLTIELKPQNDIAPELAVNMEGWLYGCDICQDVCPWNRFAAETPLSSFAPRNENLLLTKEKIELMEQEEFSKRFRKSPIKRTKLAGLKRNLKALNAARH
ncbi:MAG: tRNA epoxyqueuosine(34) reductase QueG [Bacteroidota bacterium]|nr:tRNA epoxyqueuosine(34) reductase QueG [Bacteroidota bacterium]